MVNISCTGCDFSKTYLCKECTIKRKTGKCPKCNNDIIYQSPAAKKKAIELNSVCKKCRSNQIPQLLTDEQKEFINGLLLGDASIVYAVKDKSLYPRLTLSRKEEDKDYLFWQFEIFKEFYGSEPKLKRCFDKRSKKEYNQYHLQTKSGNIFTEYYNKWYPNKIKIVPKDLKISPLMLLVWFLDDGSITNSSKNGLSLKLATDGFVENDVIFLANLLNDYFCDKFFIYKNDSNFIIKASTLPTIKFIKEIDTILPLCMERKRTWKNFDFDYVINNKIFYG